MREFEVATNQFSLLSKGEGSNGKREFEVATNQFSPLSFGEGAGGEVL
jgi:hypothetical protein